EPVAVTEGDFAALLDAFVENFKLPAQDAGEDVAHAVIVTQFAVQVIETGIAGLRAPVANFLGVLFIGRHEHATASAGDDLVAVEGKDAGVAEGSDGAFFVKCAE